MCHHEVATQVNKERKNKQQGTKEEEHAVMGTAKHYFSQLGGD
jgi:hypothetical protein